MFVSPLSDAFESFPSFCLVHPGADRVALVLRLHLMRHPCATRLRLDASFRNESLPLFAIEEQESVFSGRRHCANTRAPGPCSRLRNARLAVLYFLHHIFSPPEARCNACIRLNFLSRARIQSNFLSQLTRKLLEKLCFLLLKPCSPCAAHPLILELII